MQFQTTESFPDFLSFPEMSSLPKKKYRTRWNILQKNSTRIPVIFFQNTEQMDIGTAGSSWIGQVSGQCTMNIFGKEIELKKGLHMLPKLLFPF